MKKFIIFFFLLFCATSGNAECVYQEIIDNYVPVFAQHLRTKIPEIPKGKSINVLVAVAKDGSVKFVDYSTSSGDKEFGEFAIKSIENAGPYPAILDDIDSDVLMFTFTFMDDFKDNLPCFPEWTDTKNTSGEKIYVDLVNVYLNGESIFYNVKVYVPSLDDDIVYTIQAKPSEMVYGVSQKCKYSEFLVDPDKYLPNQAKNANSFKSISKTSPGYNAFVQALSTKVITSSSNYDNSEKEIYINQVKNRIKKSWKPVCCETSKYAVVMFKLNRKGEILDSFLGKSSGDKVFDLEALNTVKKCSPYNSFPEGLNSEFVYVQFYFFYNVK